MARNRSHTRRAPRSNPRGVLDVRRGGYGFVQTAEGEYFIPASKMNGAFDGDTVVIAPVRERGQQGGEGSAGRKRAARIVDIVQRAHTHLIGRYEVAEPFGIVVPVDTRIPYDIFTRRAETPDVPDGAIVRVEMTTYPSRREAATGRVVEVLGSEDNERVPIDLIVARHKLETKFSEATLVQAGEAVVDAEGALADGYADLRERFIFTIDPADARDFDDAVSIEPRGKGLWRLGVHIADVSHYVPWGSSVDLDARRRATSVYLVDRVIPMLPETLSNDVCSLRPGEDRRTMTVDMVIDASGRIVESDAYLAVIRSQARLSYDEAQALLEGDVLALSESGAQDLLEGEGQASLEAGAHTLLEDGCQASPEAGSQTLPEEAGELQAAPADQSVALASSLRMLSALADARRTARECAGGLDFDTTEAKVRLDESGAPIEVVLRRSTPATQLIEEAMIAANEAVARMLRDAGFPCMYRVHDKPAHEALEGLVPVLQEFPWFDAISEPLFCAGNPHEIGKVLELCSTRPEATLVTTLVLRAMKRAVYSPDLAGHYALASAAYAHFTSPIRRYPDLVVHRMLRALKTRKPELFDQEVSQLSWLAEHSSKMERVAEIAARDSQEVKIIELLEAHIGETFSALISGVATYGLYVKLENTAEGLVDIRDLGNEYFALDPIRHTLVGSDTGRTFRLGRHIAVRLVEADHTTQTLRFKFAE